MNAYPTVNGSAVARRPLRVLFVEDSESDALLLEIALKRGGFDPICARVDTDVAMNVALERQSWDLILADHSMPQFSAPKALELMKHKHLDLPFIIVSGHIEEETAIAAMNAGAHDYIMKDRLARLVPVVMRELREAEMRCACARTEEALRRSHEELEMRVEKRTADLKAANKRLHNVIEERKRLEQELLEIAENERRRIGFDLHDDLGQKLTGTLLMAKAVQQRLTREGHPSWEDTEKICGLIEQMITHTHNLARQFSSLDMQGDDVTTVLKGLADNVRKMFEVSCSFSEKGEIPLLPENAVMQFYKIAQESVSNAIKHGKARQISIGIARSGETILLTIRNDGIPFTPPANPKARMGLRIMNYRANTIGATFDIKPNARNGTIVTCEMPVKNGAKTSQKISSEAAPAKTGMQTFIGDTIETVAAGVY